MIKKMVSVKESEQLGNALNMLEALNGLLLKKAPSRKRYQGRIWISLKIEKVIEFMDGVVC